MKFSALLASIFVIITGIAFAINYNWFNGTLPGYRILAYPGILTLRFISEETPFWPKLGVMLAGQYLACFIVVFSLRKIASLKSKE